MHVGRAATYCQEISIIVPRGGLRGLGKAATYCLLNVVSELNLLQVRWSLRATGWQRQSILHAERFACTRIVRFL